MFEVTTWAVHREFIDVLPERCRRRLLRLSGNPPYNTEVASGKDLVRNLVNYPRNQNPGYSCKVLDTEELASLSKWG